MSTSAKFETISDKEVVGLFFQNYDSAIKASWASTVSNVFQSMSAVEKYAGVGNAPALREWVGGKLAKSLAEYSQTVANKDYEATLEVFTKDLRRDKTSQLLPKIQSLAFRAAQHDEKLLSAIIEGAEAATAGGLAYDGQYFIDTDHSVGDSGTINNDLTGTVVTATAPTAAELAGKILYVIQQMYGFKDDAGEPINAGMRDFLVMVPVPYWAAAVQALNSEQLQGTSGTIQNPIMSAGLNLGLVANPRLTWTTKFMVFATGGSTKPLLIQQEVAPTMKVLGDDSDHCFKHASHLYSVEKSGNVAYWDFTKAAMITLSNA